MGVVSIGVYIPRRILSENQISADLIYRKNVWNYVVKQIPVLLWQTKFSKSMK